MRKASNDLLFIFLSTPSGWRATVVGAVLPGTMYGFLSTPSGWRATFLISGSQSPPRRYFYPRPPGGGRRPSTLVSAVPDIYFYPRPPGGGRHRGRKYGSVRADFYPRPPGGGRPWMPCSALVYAFYFYPRPPGGGRLKMPGCIDLPGEFLSTPSGWRATSTNKSKIFYKKFLSTPSGWRATSGSTVSDLLKQNFYPRPPGGGRQCLSKYNYPHFYFYPRPPGGGRQYKSLSASPSIWNFYPRPPGGGRRPSPRTVIGCSVFLSTPSGWRATPQSKVKESKVKISIHALRVEGDVVRIYSEAYKTHFYPRPPGGGRPVLDRNNYVFFVFLSTPSGWRATRTGYYDKIQSKISIHALRVEGDRQWHLRLCRPRGFLSTPSGWMATLDGILHHCYRYDFYPRPPGGGRPEDEGTSNGVG